MELEDWSGKKVFAHYNMFKVDNEKNNYKITVIAYKCNFSLQPELNIPYLQQRKNFNLHMI